MTELKFKNQEAITLIALVVTIIVILILVGVSIAMLSGDNGILTRAGNARDENEKKQIEERIKLAYHSALVGGQGSYTKKSLEDELEKEFGDDFEEVDDSNDTNWILKAKGQSVTIKAGIKESKKTLISQITKDNYGNNVNYTSSNGVSDWKIFYNDGTNVYIIASDYVPHSKIDITSMNTRGMEIKTSGSYAIYGNGSQNYHFGADFVDQLTNTANWSNFATGTSGTENITATATGAPTLDMWIASWNAKGYTTLDSKPETKQKDEYEGNANYTAYYVGTGANPTTTSVSVSSDTNGYGDLLYFPHPQVSGQPDDFTNSNSVHHYWLASASAENANFVMNANFEGRLYSNNWNNPLDGVRPVVCLPSGIFGNFENGKWQLSN